MVTKKRRGKPSKDVWFLFDLRGEYHGHVATGANGEGVLMLKKGDYDKYLLSLGNEVGTPEELRFNYMVKDIDIEATRNLFDEEGFTIRKATTQDFEELEIEMNSLLGLSTDAWLSTKEFNDLGKVLNEISDGTIGSASRPDGMGMDILNLSVYNTDYDDFIRTVEEFISNDETERISGKTRRDVGQARRTWTIGKEIGPAGYYSEGRYEELDEYDGLISYDEYRSYLSSKAENR